jgi:hypothetical protein
MTASNTAMPVMKCWSYKEFINSMHVKPIDYKLAFVVPYRDREEHLLRYVPHYKGLFPEADIYVIHQLGQAPFNRGMLLNIGFLYAEDKADAFDLSDIDMLAVEDEVDYSFPGAACHLASAVSQYNYTMPYPTYFSGHVLLTAAQMRSVNGFYNDYPGYGCEDDCFYRSFMERNLPVERRYGRYESLSHERVVDRSPEIMELFNRNWELLKRPRDFSNGLDTCRYEIMGVNRFSGYVRIDVELRNEPIDNK